MKLLILLFPLLMFGQEIPKDKQLHALAGSVLTFPAYGVARHEMKLTKFESLAFSVGVSTLIGIGKELSDNRFEWADVAYTSAGSLITATIIISLDGKPIHHNTL